MSGAFGQLSKWSPLYPLIVQAGHVFGFLVIITLLYVQDAR